MSAVIICGDLMGGGSVAATRIAAPAEGPGQTQAHSERAGRSGAIFVTGAVACISGEPGSRRNGNHGRLSAINLSRTFRRPGAVSRVQDAYQSHHIGMILQGPPMRFQGQFSFRDASASCLQSATGAIPNVREVVGEVRNVVG